MASHVYSIPTRRSLFGAAAALPVIAASGAGSADTHPDAQLIALGRQWEAALARWMAAGEAADNAWARVTAATPPKPDALRVLGQDWTDIGGVPRGVDYYGPRHRGQIVKAIKSNARFAKEYPLRAARVARWREVLRVLDAHTATVAAIELAHGVAELDRRENDLGMAVDPLNAAIIASRATTVEGLRVKARVLARFSGIRPAADRADLDEAVMWSIIDDLAGQRA